MHRLDYGVIFIETAVAIDDMQSGIIRLDCWVNYQNKCKVSAQTGEANLVKFFYVKNVNRKNSKHLG